MSAIPTVVRSLSAQGQGAENAGASVRGEDGQDLGGQATEEGREEGGEGGERGEEREEREELEGGGETDGDEEGEANDRVVRNVVGIRLAGLMHLRLEERAREREESEREGGRER